MVGVRTNNRDIAKGRRKAAEIEALVSALAPVIHSYVEKLLIPVGKKIEQLEAKLRGKHSIFQKTPSKGKQSGRLGVKKRCDAK
jgi:hypothetical protein